VRVSGSSDGGKFGVEGVPVTLAPGVRVTSTSVSTRFAPAAFNPAHTRYIARSEKAKPMAVNMYSGWWSLVVCVLVTVIVSLFTRPKPDHELTNLVMGLTPLPDSGPCAWYERPKLWAAAIIAALVAINIIFW
jgi:SSS family solute:Na+ symporter